MKNKSIVYFNSHGPTGNVYVIMAMVRDVMRKEARFTDFNTMRDRVFESSSYAEALAIMREYVDIVDVDGSL